MIAYEPISQIDLMSGLYQTQLLIVGKLTNAKVNSLLHIASFRQQLATTTFPSLTPCHISVFVNTGRINSPRLQFPPVWTLAVMVQATPQRCILESLLFLLAYYAPTSVLHFFTACFICNKSFWRSAVECTSPNCRVWVIARSLNCWSLFQR